MKCIYAALLWPMHCLYYPIQPMLAVFGLESLVHLEVVSKHRGTSRGEVMMTKGDSKINKKHGGTVGGQKICCCDSSVKYQCNEKLY